MDIVIKNPWGKVCGNNYIKSGFEHQIAQTPVELFMGYVEFPIVRKGDFSKIASHRFGG